MWPRKWLASMDKGVICTIDTRMGNVSVAVLINKLLANCYIYIHQHSFWSWFDPYKWGRIKSKHSTEQLQIEDLAEVPSSGSLAIQWFELTTLLWVQYNINRWRTINNHRMRGCRGVDGYQLQLSHQGMLKLLIVMT